MKKELSSIQKHGYWALAYDTGHNNEIEILEEYGFHRHAKDALNLHKNLKSERFNNLRIVQFILA